MKTRKNTSIVMQLMLFLPVLVVLFFLILILQSDGQTPTGFRVNRLDQTHQEVVNQSEHVYSITTNALIDADRTLEIGHADVSVFDLTRSLTIENIGTTAIHNPRIVVNGKRNWTTLDDMLAEIITPQMTEKEKALAIWYFVRENRYHYLPAEEYGNELHDPVIFMNVYGYGFCDDSARNLAMLWQAAGLQSRVWVLSGHVVSEVWFDGQYHMLDADTNAFYLLPDNRVIAEVSQLQEDPWLIKRTHHFGRFSKADLLADEGIALVYGDDDFLIDIPEQLDRNVEMVLRPGESFEWIWNQDGLYHDIMYHEGPPPYYANGKMVYEPNLSSDQFRNYLDEETGMTTRSVDGLGAKIHAAQIETEGDQPASFTIRIDSPYVIVGGNVRIESMLQQNTDVIHVSISEDRETWQTLWTSQETGLSLYDIDLIDWVAPFENAARYTYYLKFDIEASGNNPKTGINYLSIETDVQVAPLSMPALSAGYNSIEYRDDTEKPHQALLTYQWIENCDHLPAQPPQELVYPLDGSQVSGTNIQFEWQPPVDSEGVGTSAYHFLLSENPAATFPLSPNFDLVVSENRFLTPDEGLLNSGQTYYWKVRSRDASGVWSDWSDTWSFTPFGPGAPLNIRPDSSGRLLWDENPDGNTPVSYEIYASSWRGFIPSKDVHSEVEWGSDQNVVLEEDANFIQAVQTPAFDIPQEYLDEDGVMYYRVVAVDRDGNRSAPSMSFSFP